MLLLWHSLLQFVGKCFLSPTFVSHQFAFVVILCDLLNSCFFSKFLVGCPHFTCSVLHFSPDFPYSEHILHSQALCTAEWTANSESSSHGAYACCAIKNKYLSFTDGSQRQLSSLQKQISYLQNQKELYLEC